jgi:ribosome-associated protein
MGMIEITPNIYLDESEIHFDYVRASGPGGQNVNKVATAVQLRFDVHGSPSLTPAMKKRLVKLAGKRMTTDGMLLIDARRHRTQAQNREDALQRLVALTQKALVPPKKRVPTRPTVAAKRARLQAKKKRSQLKKSRRNVRDDWE